MKRSYLWAIAFLISASLVATEMVFLEEPDLGNLPLTGHVPLERHFCANVVNNQTVVGYEVVRAGTIPVHVARFGGVCSREGIIAFASLAASPGLTGLYKCPNRPMTDVVLTVAPERECGCLATGDDKLTRTENQNRPSQTKHTTTTCEFQLLGFVPVATSGATPLLFRWRRVVVNPLPLYLVTLDPNGAEGRTDMVREGALSAIFVD